jgi:ribonuclease P protein component
MIPKRNKFSTEDFANKGLFKNSKKTITAYGYFSVLEKGNKKAVILSKKNFKTAVLRNKYKRLFFNALLEVQKDKPELVKTSFVFYPKKTFTKEEIVLDLSKIML